jgi:hypothetical protein
MNTQQQMIKEQILNRVEIYFYKLKQLGTGVLTQLYSPMFDKKLNELTDDELKQQITLWVEEELK